ncbi:L-dopachrome tautomerase yellow-f2-like [Phlebotomus papatasi]|uniref:L-dopachrome tautomerase yellow-f2-like n=1 Tax=Phlebotomus papatasi TaxID=29031 RepID=UPI00248348CF|nr:L-dopachrome tautomerase yellow-f2-like [Phlebotomus papatasi]
MNNSVFWIIFAHIGYFCVNGIYNNGVENVYYWKNVLFENLPLFDDTVIGKYPYHIPENNDINGMQYHTQSGLMITTLARIRPGIPSTLNAFCVPDYDKGTSPYLWGFPDYEKNTLKASFYDESYYNSRKVSTENLNYSAGYRKHFFSHIGQNEMYSNARKTKYPYNYFNDFSIISTYFPCVDNQCNRLFALDTGVLRYDTPYIVQNPALIVFNLPSNGCRSRNFPLIRRVEIPGHLWKESSGFRFITLDYQPKGSCDDLFVYISNIVDSSIVVYDYKRDDFWVFSDSTMKPINAEASFTFKDITYVLPIGIVNLALGWPDKHGNRNAYYAPGSTLAEYVVSTKLLKDSKRSPSNYDPEEFTLIGYRGCDSNTYKQVFDLSTGVIFFGEMDSNKIRCWNTRMPLNPDTIGVVYESDESAFFGGLSIDSDEYLWFLTNQLPALSNTAHFLDLTEVNSRIFRVKVYDAIKGTVCDNSNIFYKI